MTGVADRWPGARHALDVELRPPGREPGRQRHLQLLDDEPSGALELTLEALADENVDLVALGAECAALLDGSEALHVEPLMKPLIKLLAHKEPQLRRRAAWALGEFGPAAEQALGALRRRRRDQEETVQETAREVIEKIEGLGSLDRPLRSRGSGSSRNPWWHNFPQISTSQWTSARRGSCPMDDTLQDLTAAELEQHSIWLQRMVRGLAGCEAGAQDLVQESWARLAASGGAGPRSLRPYLLGIARRVSRATRVREARRRGREERSARAEALPSAAELASRLELSQLLGRELAALEPDQRDVLMWRYQDNLSAAEIARRLGVPASTVRTRQRSGLRALRERLERSASWNQSLSALLARWPAGHASASSAGGMATGVWMAGKGMVAAVAVVALGIGVWIWSGVGRPGIPGPGTTAVEIGARLDELVDVPREAVATAGAVERVDLGQPVGVPSAPAGPLRLRLEDADSGLPFPEYAVEVTDEQGRTEVLRSDEDGGITGTLHWPPGALRLRAVDLTILEECNGWEEQVITIDHDLDSDPARIVPLRSGPTYSLETRIPEGLAAADFMGELLPTVQSNVVMAGDAPLRAGEPPWIRFGPGVPDFPGSGPWALTLRSEDGFWMGSALVDSNRGVHPSLVALELEARGGLEVTVHTATPIPPGSHGGVELTGITALTAEGLPARPRHVVNVPDGPNSTRSIWRYLRPGEYRLDYTDTRFEPLDQRVRIEAGRTASTAIDLRPRSDLAPIAGVLRGADGPLSFRNVNISLYGGSPEPSNFHHLIYDPEVVEERAFRFEGLPPGDYVLRVLSGEIRGVSEEVRVHAGDQDVVVECVAMRPGARIRFDFEVRDADTGELLRYATISTGNHRGGGTLSLPRSTGRLSCEEPEGSDFTWVIYAAGHVPRWGTQADLDPDVTLQVELEPGWGAEFMLTDEEGQPVPGVRLQLDGQSTDSSDESGHLRAVRATRPTQVSVSDPRWSLGTQSAENLLDQMTEISLYLRRRD